NVVGQAGSVANGQARYKGQASVVRNSRGQDRQSSCRVRIKAESGSGRKQTGCRYRGSWETYTKALITGLAIP
ncbi:unnamed protein product, partial [Staurois parvus]